MFFILFEKMLMRMSIIPIYVR